MGKVFIYPECNDIVAHLVGVRGELRHVANEKAAIARGYLAAHRSRRGTKWGHSEITVTHGILDYYVNLDDTRSQRAAAAIEFGNRYGGGDIHVLKRTFGF